MSHILLVSSPPGPAIARRRSPHQHCTGSGYQRRRSEGHERRARARSRRTTRSNAVLSYAAELCSSSAPDKDGTGAKEEAVGMTAQLELFETSEELKQDASKFFRRHMLVAGPGGRRGYETPPVHSSRLTRDVANNQEIVSRLRHLTRGREAHSEELAQHAGMEGLLSPVLMIASFVFPHVPDSLSHASMGLYFTLPLAQPLWAHTHDLNLRWAQGRYRYSEPDAAGFIGGVLKRYHHHFIPHRKPREGEVDAVVGQVFESLLNDVARPSEEGRLSLTATSEEALPAETIFVLFERVVSDLRMAPPKASPFKLFITVCVAGPDSRRRTTRHAPAATYGADWACISLELERVSELTCWQEQAVPLEG